MTIYDQARKIPIRDVIVHLLSSAAEISENNFKFQTGVITVDTKKNTATYKSPTRTESDMTTLHAAFFLEHPNDENYYVVIQKPSHHAKRFPSIYAKKLLSVFPPAPDADWIVLKQQLAAKISYSPSFFLSYFADIPFSEQLDMYKTGKLVALPDAGSFVLTKWNKKGELVGGTEFTYSHVVENIEAIKRKKIIGEIKRNNIGDGYKRTQRFSDIWKELKGLELPCILRTEKVENKYFEQMSIIPIDARRTLRAIVANWDESDNILSQKLRSTLRSLRGDLDNAFLEAKWETLGTKRWSAQGVGGISPQTISRKIRGDVFAGMLEVDFRSADVYSIANMLKSESLAAKLDNEDMYANIFLKANGRMANEDERSETKQQVLGWLNGKGESTLNVKMRNTLHETFPEIKAAKKEYESIAKKQSYVEVKGEKVYTEEKKEWTAFSRAMQAYTALTFQDYLSRVDTALKNENLGEVKMMLHDSLYVKPAEGADIKQIQKVCNYQLGKMNMDNKYVAQYKIRISDYVPVFPVREAVKVKEMAMSM